MVVEKNKIIAHLRWLAAGGTPENTGTGLCSEVRNKINMSSLFLNHYFTTWKHYSGVKRYPVPATNSKYKGSPASQYYGTKNLWIRKQGELRRDLCRHIADQMEMNDD